METRSNQVQGIFKALEKLQPTEWPSGNGLAEIDSFNLSSKYLSIYSSYHVMNEEGFYVGWADFKVMINRYALREYQVQFLNPSSRWLNLRYQLRDYLEDSMYDFIQSLAKEVNPLPMPKERG